MKDLYKELYAREYARVFRLHTIGMENMPISPYTMAIIRNEAHEDTCAILDEKAMRLYKLLQKRKGGAAKS